MSKVIGEQLAAAVTAYDKSPRKPLLDTTSLVDSNDFLDRVDAEPVVSLRRDKFIHASTSEQEMPVVVRNPQPEVLLNHCYILLTSAHGVVIALAATPFEGLKIRMTITGELWRVVRVGPWLLWNAVVANVGLTAEQLIDC